MNILTFTFAFLISAGCFWMSFKLLRLYFRVKNWQRTKAKINSKEVILHPKYSTPKAPYGLKVEYSYEVDTVIYTGHILYLAELVGGQVNMMKSDAEKRLSKIGNEISVFVNPADHSQSVAYCEGIGIYLFIFTLGIFSCLVGLGALLN